MDFGSKLAELRKAQGWNQEELASRMEVSRQAVSKWESGQSLPEMEKVLQLCDLFQVSADALLRPEQCTQAQTMEKLLVSRQQAQAYLDARNRAGGQIALATLLCVLSPVCMLALTAQAEMQKLEGLIDTGARAGIIGLCVLLALVAAAVVLFIRSGGANQAFSYLDGEDFMLSADAQQMVQACRQREQARYTKLNAIGAALAILSVIPLLAAAALYNTEAEVIYGLCVMLCVVGAAVTCFVAAGVRHNALMRLLHQEEFAPERRQRQKRYAGISTAYWLVVTAAYLAWSLPQDAWQRSWIVWPVAGVIFAALRCLMNR